MSANAMTVTTTTSTASKKPCGCGGQGGTDHGCGQGCGCGNGAGCGCQSCQPVLYARPQFFAGQLLTEADLQSLGGYVVAKNRLHNRYLFGDGVVCGLSVTCPPCASGKVTVNPGYALDCCGNDIVVSCSAELDINQMVRQLMAKSHRADCGEPCAGTTNQSANTSARMVAPATATTAPGRRYCLYIDYCEQASDPVAPYATGDTCGQATCEPTRIRENFRFELRCPEEQACEPGAIGRFKNCLADSKLAERIVANSAFLKTYLPPIKTALAAIREQPIPVFEESRWKQLKDRTLALKHALAPYGNHMIKDLDEAKLHPVLDNLLLLAGDAARLWLHPDPKLYEGQDQSIQDAADGLLSASEAIPAAAIDRIVHAPLPRAYALALLQLSRELALDLRGQKQQDAAVTAVLSGSKLDYNLLAHGAVLTDRLLAAVFASLSETRDWLQDHLEQAGTHCKLLGDVNAVTLQTPRPGAELSVAGTNNALLAGNVYVPAVDEVLRACLCNALIPDCGVCDDPSVLLACLTVQDCKVTNICNLDRKFVLTAPNLRYWLPICGVGKALEQWCCPTCPVDQRDDARDTAVPLSLRSPREELLALAMGNAPAFMKTAVAAMLATPESDRGPMEALAHIFNKKTPEAAETSAVLDAAKELQGQLQIALADVRTLKREQTRLQSRVAKLEKPKPAEVKP
jgi:hypothetical protein